MANPTDKFTIIGGGYTGLILALYLTERGFRNIEVLDREAELVTLQNSSIFTVRHAPEIKRLADLLEVDPDYLYKPGIQYKRWIGIKEEVPDFVFDGKFSNDEHSHGLINPNSTGLTLLNVLRNRDVYLGYGTKVVVDKGMNGQRLLAISSQQTREIRTDYLLDATNIGFVLRALIGTDGKPLLNDDPIICDMLGLRVDGIMNTDTWISVFGNSFGPFSWITPSSPSEEHKGFSGAIDIIATRYCHLSERREDILVKRVRNMLKETRSPLFSSQGVKIKNLEELINLSEEDLSEKTNMRGILRLEPTDNIPLNSAPYSARKGMFLVGNAAGWGNPATGNIWYASLQIIEMLTLMLKNGQEGRFFNRWRYNSAIDYDSAMAFFQTRLKPDHKCSKRARRFYLSLSKLPEDAKFAAATGSNISLRNKLRLVRGNFLYMAELMAKAYLPFKMGYVISGGYCYGKKNGAPLKPLVLELTRGFSRETRAYGY